MKILGIGALIAALIAVGYGAEGNWTGFTLFGGCYVILGFFWMESRRDQRK